LWPKSHATVRWMPLLIGLAAAILRVVPWLSRYPLHRDEALYGSWARLIASGVDPLLLTTWVDKPPLVLYALAGSIRAFGTSELALRFPGMLASILTALLLYGFARYAYGLQVAVLAAGIFAASPFAILFAPTAFTDPWLTLWIVAAAWAAIAGRPFLAGLGLGLAVASKQQGLLGVPLVVALLFLPEIAGIRPLKSASAAVRRVAMSLFGFAVVFGPLFYWDSLRWSNRPSFWDRSLATYGGLKLATVAAWPQRAEAWASQLGLVFGHPVLTTLMLALVVVAGVRGLRLALSMNRGVQDRPALPGSIPDTVACASANALDGLLALYMAGYLVVHLIFAFQVWDRYLLPLVPFIALLAARGALIVWRIAARHPVQARFAERVQTVTTIGFVIALGWATWLGTTGRLPIGSDHGAYAGLNDVIAVLHAQPKDAIIYDHSLGWYYDFYLFGAPQERRWWPDPSKLADLAARTAATEPQRDQWLVMPEWEASAEPEMDRSLAVRRLRLTEARRIFRPDGSMAFIMYRIEPLAGSTRP
jgi:4-amino-4-deoxy-L-arabinose transferase-like glycosyltransferase